MRACVRASVRVSLASDSSETVDSSSSTELGTVTISYMRMHHVLIIIFTLTFIQDHTDLNHKNKNFDYFRHFSNNVHRACCRDSTAKVLSNLQSQSDDLALHPRSKLRLRLAKFFYLYYNSNVSDSV